MFMSPLLFERHKGLGLDPPLWGGQKQPGGRKQKHRILKVSVSCRIMACLHALTGLGPFLYCL